MASLGLIRRLPGPLRKLLVGGVDRVRRVLEPRLASDLPDARTMRLLARPAGRRYVGTRVAVAGLFGSRCGLQRGAELFVMDLRARGIEVLAFDLSAHLNMDRNLQTSAIEDTARLLAWQPTDIVIHLNPPLFARAIALFPAALRSQVSLVGYWVWELTVLPASWQHCATLVDEIWTPSPFVTEVVATALPNFAGPIKTVPHAVARDPMPSVPAAARAELRVVFGLPQNAFVVGTSFSFDSNYTRKNPCAAIDAFRLAFRSGEQTVLLIRCNDVAKHRRMFDHMVSFTGGDTRILIWDVANQPCPLKDFYGLLDIYISLHRCEGYGLNLAEALQTGLPVLATGWRLAPDIAALPAVHKVMSRLVVILDIQDFYNSVSGGVWAEPDIFDASASLKQLYNNALPMPLQYDDLNRIHNVY